MAASGQLPAFPARSSNDPLAFATCSSRPAIMEDVAFLRRLYRSFRADELALVPWSPEDKHAFLDEQFNLQHRYYIAAFPLTDFLIIEKEGVSIGRLYIDRSAETWHIIDIGLLPEWRNRGIGQSILIGIKAAAAVEDDRPRIMLHVDKVNGPAHKLYRASGFEVTDESGTHLRMQWSSGQVARNCQ